jgi:hypothetical protein
MRLLSRALVRAAIPALITFLFLALSYIAFGQVNHIATTNPTIQTPSWVSVR